jgi:ubiquinone/menaquinone biosynthesis C-methylase UbiE
MRDYQFQIPDLYKKIAENYYKVNIYLSAGFFYYWRWKVSRKICNIIKNRDISNVIELGVGLGEQIEYIYKTCPQLVGCVNFTGLDISEDMLGIARCMVGEGGLVRGDMLRLPFDKQTFDMAYCIFSVRNLPGEKIESFFERVNGLLKPGGVFFMVEALPPSNLLASVYIKYIISNMGSLLTGKNEPYKYLSKSILNFPDSYEIEEYLRKTGFVNVGVEYLPPLSSVGIFTGICKK